MIIDKQQKLAIIRSKIGNLEAQKYEISLQIKVSKILKDRSDEMIEQLENNIPKLDEAIALLNDERLVVESEEDTNGSV